MKRARKGTAKSREGCASCKSRRVKCDETRPACRNCVRLNIQCPGYQHQLRWSKKHEKFPSTYSLPLPQEQQLGTGQGIMIEQQLLAQDEPDFLCHQTRPLTPFHDSIWLSTYGNVSPFWQAMYLTPDPDPHGRSNLGNEFAQLSAFEMQTAGSQNTMPDHRILQTPVDIPTTLIEYWFARICPMRSTFDSAINYNRYVAWTTWSVSKPVNLAMQAMSTACLVGSMPHLRQLMLSLAAQAVAATDCAKSLVWESHLPVVTSDLVFAVFALGTSLHWIHPGIPEDSWLDSARDLLSIWKLTLAAEEQIVYAYFSQALTYWEMSLAAVGRGSISTIVQKKRQRHQNRLRSAILSSDTDNNYEDPLQGTATHEAQPYDSCQPVFGTRPSSWCGVSNEVINIFGQVLALCRSTCLRKQDKNTVTVAMASDILCDMALACDLKRELQAMDFNALILMEETHGHAVQTQDDNTPISHLLQTAEAYRQAALLQLHLTFTDLSPAPQGPHPGFNFLNSVSPDSTSSIPSEQLHIDSIVAQSLRLASTLEKIPIGSGSRFIHPMLYLSVAAGLRYRTGFQPTEPYSMNGISEACLGQEPSDLAETYSSYDAVEPAPLPSESFYPWTSHLSDAPTVAPSQSSQKVSSTRQFVWDRLSSLKQTLPHSASNNMLQLVKALWSGYDSMRPDSINIHWLKILKESGLGMLLL